MSFDLLNFTFVDTGWVRVCVHALMSKMLKYKWIKSICFMYMYEDPRSLDKCLSIICGIFVKWFSSSMMLEKVNLCEILTDYKYILIWEGFPVSQYFIDDLRPTPNSHVSEKKSLIDEVSFSRKNIFIKQKIVFSQN